jgi:hypothetical protein
MFSGRIKVGSQFRISLFAGLVTSSISCQPTAFFFLLITNQHQILAVSGIFLSQQIGTIHYPQPALDYNKIIIRYPSVPKRNYKVIQN